MLPQYYGFGPTIIFLNKLSLFSTFLNERSLIVIKVADTFRPNCLKMIQFLSFFVAAVWEAWCCSHIQIPALFSSEICLFCLTVIVSALSFFSMRRKRIKKSQRTGLCQWSLNINISIGKRDSVQQRDLCNTATNRFCQHRIRSTRTEQRREWDKERKGGKMAEDKWAKCGYYQWLNVSDLI